MDNFFQGFVHELIKLAAEPKQELLASLARSLAKYRAGYGGIHRRAMMVELRKKMEEIQKGSK